MRQQSVFVGDIRVSMKTDRGYVVRSFAGFFIQGLNVFEHVLEFQIAGIDFVRRQRVEHESVVGIRRMR